MEFEIASSEPGGVAQVATVLSLPTTPANHPEGVAVDPEGAVYVGNRRAEGELFVSEILKRNPSGKFFPIATLGFTASGEDEGALGTVDGIAVDIDGNIHGVIPGAASLGTAPLVKVTPNSGSITSTVIDVVEFAKFDVPLSLAFGTVAPNQTSVFVTNGDLTGAPPEGEGEPGPGLLRVELGVAGLPDSAPLTAAATASQPSTQALSPTQQ